jgi:Macrophage migration inhibitory factor (MIF)
MPYLSILTNARVADVRHSELLAAASRVVASQLSKPENCVMVSIAPGQRLVFAGSEELAAFLELRKHWFARCEARLTLHGVDRLDSRVLRYSQGSYLSGDGRRGRKTLGPRRKDVWLANVSQDLRSFDLCKKPAFDVHGAPRQSRSPYNSFAFPAICLSVLERARTSDTNKVSLLSATFTRWEGSSCDELFVNCQEFSNSLLGKGRKE